MLLRLTTVLRINDSDLLSNAFVASSRTIILGLEYKALANPILCFCPPEIFDPSSPKIVSNPLFRDFKKWFSSTKSRHFFIHFKSISLGLLPKTILFFNLITTNCLDL